MYKSLQMRNLQYKFSFNTLHKYENGENYDDEGTFKNRVHYNATKKWELAK